MLIFLCCSFSIQALAADAASGSPQACKEAVSANYSGAVVFTRIAKKLAKKGIPMTCREQQAGIQGEPAIPASPAQDSSLKKSTNFKKGTLTYHYYPATAASSDGKRRVVISLCGGPQVCTSSEGGFGRNSNIPPEFGVIVFDYPGMGENAEPLDTPRTLDDVGDAVVAIVKAEGLVGAGNSLGGQGNYMLYGVSFGTAIATIAGSKLGDTPPVSILLDSTEDLPPPMPPLPPQKTIPTLVQSTTQSAGLKNAFLQKLQSLLSILGGDNQDKAGLQTYFNQVDPHMLQNMVTQKWSLQDIASCVEQFTKAASPPSKKALRQYKQANNLMKVEYCGDKQYDSANYPIPVATAIDYIVGTGDPLTWPSSMSQYHLQTQSKCSIGGEAGSCSRVVSVFSGVTHGEFTLGPDATISPACEAFVWKNVFSQVAMNFSSGSGRSSPCPKEP